MIKYTIDNQTWLLDSNQSRLSLRPARIPASVPGHVPSREPADSSPWILECVAAGQLHGVTPKPPRASRRTEPRGNPKREATAI